MLSQTDSLACGPIVAANQASLVKSLANVPLVVTFAPSYIDDLTGLAGVVPPDCVASVRSRVHKLVHFDHSFTSYTVFSCEWRPTKPLWSKVSPTGIDRNLEEK